MLTFDELRKANVSRCNSAFHPLEEWNPLEWVAAVAGEVGELANLLKKNHRGDFDDVPADDVRCVIAKELADSVIYLDLLAARCQIDLGEAVRNKFNEVSIKRNASERL